MMELFNTYQKQATENIQKFFANPQEAFKTAHEFNTSLFEKNKAIYTEFVEKFNAFAKESWEQNKDFQEKLQTLLKKEKLTIQDISAFYTKQMTDLMTLNSGKILKEFQELQKKPKTK